MTPRTETQPAGSPRRLSLPDRQGWGVLSLFTATTFLSAFLLFFIQPMFAKMVLPLLGGAPSVWAVALLFFQGALLVGYGYAHLLVRRVPAASTGFVHLALAALAFLALPIAIPAGWSEPPTSDPYFWQLGLFAVAIGLPFVAVSANAPLLQAWFARTGHKDSADPYFLYAASNFGSLLALLGYPLLFEPAFGLKALASLWAAGFALLVLALAACFLVVRGATAPRADIPEPVSAATGLAPRTDPDWQARAAWVGLAFVPSALLTAFTTHVATDIASAPLIWVIPLSLYLATFVVVFRERALIPRPVLLTLHAVAVVLALLQLAQTEKETWFYSAGFGVAAFVTATLVAHRTLYEARPDARHLTEFYLWMSVGGVLGGIFAALLAPQIFAEVFEYPLLLALSFACRPGALDLRRENQHALTVLIALVAAAAAIIHWGPGLASEYQLDFRGWGSTAAIAALFALVALAVWRHPPHLLVVAMSLYMAVVLLPSGVHRGNAERSYFGVYRVIQSGDGEFNVLQHGTTLHGAQRIRDANGKLVANIQPATYYHARGPMASAVRLTSMIGAATRSEPTFGVIGLGAGSLACHSSAGETWRFFEIDPVVVSIANSKKFTFLANCQPDAHIILGDARLTVAREEDESYDLLIVDAFSSDAIPVHLLTAEALRLYASKIKPEGAVVLHISNRYLDLEQVLAATFPTIGGLHALTIEDQSEDDGYAVTGSTVVVFGKSWEAIDRFRVIPGARNLPEPRLRPWTDDFSDVLGPFLSQYRKHH
ncbi:fused MFS/spermidine synthase [Hyphomicrobium sp.]|uniref:spermidine synthase n=1 Tax=Hyphomicrobium sp. TaxID=82 RepID=UPI0025BC508B|nr:fused MFS/spermidine synthase [Hyphomicrobium sp.]MCC7250926.1 fused MFS/spermidine synthase [Hyphomicrobium sp.]